MPLRAAVYPLAASASAHPPRQCLLLPLLFPQELPPSPMTGHHQQQRHQRSFHSSRQLRDAQIDNARNHYEALKLEPGASPADIKKSFYALSKSHHPDHNRASPHASRRFMRISEAYSVLSIPAKRAAYDRDTLRLHHVSHGHAHHHRGSYASTGPAGGRPASGLSRRRGTFTGPPPSFFRSGGWGAQGAKRRAAHEGFSSSSTSGTGSSGNGSGSGGNASAGGGSSAGGMGPGQTPFRDAAWGAPPPHFDRAAHERTGRESDRRRAARQQEMERSGRSRFAEIEPERGVAGMFFIIGGIIMVSILGPLALSRLWRTGGGGSGGREKEAKRKRAGAGAGPGR
ncbi:DnaJ-domain-containing protein [Whalleya microplaca]|nr:DnaJ-domain-containing protein [Whalleya microplaca]